ncbi:lipoxygenase [Limtongia smithiae]|uniref:lipoxygenase n=1 Tax=Limtongia smithiae TaxID=1125753 RepID=UPI0034CD8986
MRISLAILLPLAGAAVAAPLEKRSTNLVAELLATLAESFEAASPTPSETGLFLLEELLTPLTTSKYATYAGATNITARAENIERVRASFTYETLSSGGAYYPAGELGVAKNALDVTNIAADLTPQIEAAEVDGTKALADVYNYGGLTTLDDYVKLYNGEWTNSLPNGPDKGVLTNYTQDLFFSMQRLSTSPFILRRLRPSAGVCIALTVDDKEARTYAGDHLPFSVDDETAVKITGKSLQQLFYEGRLFHADHSSQADLVSTGRYSAACDAYFYIADSGDFLPLAIRTNVGSNLIYTPLDSEGDWMLAKLMFNVNDFWFAQWNHLAQTHQVVQIVWMAAIRTISRDHPVFAILNRLTYEAFSISVLAQSILFPTGGAVDLIFAYSGTSANNYTNDRYSGGAGKFRSNYLITDLEGRCLLDCFGPPLTHFPYYEDAYAIRKVIRNFFNTFVRSYYPTDCDIQLDKEIQAWVAECNGPAGVFDFPATITTIDTLINVLTHIAHLVSTAHHAVNTNELLQVSGTLPFNPPALYAPIPTKKSSTTNPVDYLPGIEKVIEQLIVGALFARPQLVGTDRTLLNMFNNATMLDLMNEETKSANAVFMVSMKAFSEKVKARTFNSKGLSQGMPFLWQALDPTVAPYSITV